MPKHGRGEDEDERESKDLRILRLQAELEEARAKCLSLSCMRPHRLIAEESSGALPTVVQHSDVLLHYELDVMRKQNDSHVRKVFDLEKELKHKTNPAAAKDENAQLMDATRRENEAVVKENLDLKQKLHVQTSLVNHLKKDLKEASQRCAVLEEENERLSSQMQIWQQMQLHSATGYGESEDLPDMVLPGADDE